MADELSQHDTLSLALQSAVDKKLATGEQVLMSLAGASGEALVASDQRVMIVREQMPVIGSMTGVDCFDHQYEQIQTAVVEGAVGGGHLKLLLLSPPADDHQVTIFFPSYDLAKFDAAAARIRLLVEQTRGVPPDSAAPLLVSSASEGIVCVVCSQPVHAADMYCSACGTPQGKACSYCARRVQRGSRFCSNCGNPLDSARELICVACKQPLAPAYSFCPRCGRQQGRLCPYCGKRAHASWVSCAHCGRALDSLPTQPSAAALSGVRAGGGQPRSASAESAEEHNQRGMQLYEQERYQEAVDEFIIAISLAPDTTLYHCNLGVVYADMGRDAEALQEYNTAIRLNPSEPTAYLNLGYFHSERENKDEAVRNWRKVLEIAPDTSDAEEARQNLTNEHAS